MTREGREAGTRKPVASGVWYCHERERESPGRTASGSDGASVPPDAASVSSVLNSSFIPPAEQP